MIRRREERDLDALAALAADVQRNDGYPGKRPRDLRTFLVSDDALGAWVAEREGSVAGHVALHRTSLPVVMECARRALASTADDELAVVARLIVSPTARREGIGRLLLERAATAARGLGRHPILDVVTRYDAANALYLAAGWVNAGEVEMRFADGTTLSSYVYVAPP
jgi:GNAT superfamily N-acetyltransferase